MVKGFFKATLFVVSLRKEQYLNRENNELVEWSVIGFSDGSDTKEFNISNKFVYQYDNAGKQISEKPVIEMFKQYDVGFDYDTSRKKINIVAIEPHKN